MRRNVQIIIMIISSVLCVLCGYYGISLLMEQREQQANLFLMKDIAEQTEVTEERYETEETTQAQEITTDLISRDEPMPEMPEKLITEESKQNLKACPIDFAALQKKYPDVYAWITVPGTNVDYAVVQHKAENGFYLNHGYQQDYTAYGAIYSEKENKKDFSDPVTVLYGHNMIDGTMFASLHKFEEQSFFDQHREFTIITPKACYTYRIFAAHIFSNVHVLNKYELPKKAGMREYLKDIYDSGTLGELFTNAPKATESDKIVTLSTCRGLDHSIRYMLQGVLISTEQYAQ